MKRILTMAVALMLVGCLSGPAKFIIPDEPQFKRFAVHQVEGGICMNNEAFEVFRQNVIALKDYVDKMRKILMDIQKEK